LEQVLVWDSFTVKHGQLQYSVFSPPGCGRSVSDF
jgi:hypothetical protein